MKGHFAQTRLTRQGVNSLNTVALLRFKLQWCKRVALMQAHVDSPAPFNFLQQTMLYHTDGV